MAVDVLVIGAGPAGIASAYFLEKAGISYKVIDRAEVIASTWAQQYPSLRLNTSRFYSHMPGLKFPLHYGLFASAQQYHDYLTDFVNRYDFNIHLGIEVMRVEPDGDGWRVETSTGVDWYPAVVLATGRFSKPFVPELPGIEQFSGRILHSRDYRGPQPFVGQRVMVVGNGPSGIDISTALPNTVKLPVYLAQRTGLILKPRYPFGLPKHGWMLLAEKFPNRVTHWLEKRALQASYADTGRYGIKVPGPGEESGAAGTRGPELINAVRIGRVQPVGTPVGFDGQAVLLSDGSRLDIDVLLLATGFRPALDYLKVDYDIDGQGLPVREAQPYPVYAGYAPHPGYQVKRYRGLFLIGIYYKGRGAMYNFNVEAEIITRQIQQHLTGLPHKLTPLVEQKKNTADV